MLRQDKKGTKAKVVYPNGNGDETGGSLLVCLGIDGVNETIEARVAPSFEYECVFGMDGANRFGFQVDYGSKYWRLPGLPIHSFTEEAESENRKIKQRYRNYSPKITEYINKELDELLEANMVEPSASEWSNPIVMVTMSDGTYRMCLDFRKVNEVAKKDVYPLPHMDTILSKLRSARYITTIDLSKVFHQIPLARNSREYTAFTVPGRGLFQYKRMPFGLSVAPVTFQRLMDRLIGPELEPHVFTYLDDIIVVSETFEEHFKWLEKVLTILQKAGFTVNQEKSHFCCLKVRYLGYILNEHELTVDPDKVQGIKEYPAPKTIKHLRRLLGMVSWYRRFIVDCALRMEP